MRRGPRARVRVALIAAVMAGLGGIGFALGRALLQRSAAPVGAGEAVRLPDVSQRIREFRRVRVSDGRKVWELKAREARYLEGSGEIVVTGPELAFYEEGGTVRLSGREGRVRLAGRELDRVDLHGRIEVRRGDLRARAEEASYLRDRGVIVVRDGLRISSRTLTLTGDVLVVELRDERVRVMGHVVTTFRAADDGGVALTEPVARPPLRLARRGIGGAAP